MLHSVNFDDISFIIVQRKIQPSYSGGYVFSRRQIIATVNEQGYAEQKAIAHHSSTGEKVAVWKCNYDKVNSCISLLQLISVSG